MARQSVFDMPFSRVYPMLISKAERKGRTRKEVDEVTSWLTGYSPAQIDEALSSEITYGDFFSGAPAYNPRADLITGKICGIQVEAIEDPLMKKIRQLDKLVDELARGKKYCDNPRCIIINSILINSSDRRSAVPCPWRLLRSARCRPC